MSMKSRNHNSYMNTFCPKIYERVCYSKYMKRIGVLDVSAAHPCHEKIDVSPSKPIREDSTYLWITYVTNKGFSDIFQL